MANEILEQLLVDYSNNKLALLLYFLALEGLLPFEKGNKDIFYRISNYSRDSSLKLKSIVKNEHGSEGNLLIRTGYSTSMIATQEVLNSVISSSKDFIWKVDPLEKKDEDQEDIAYLLLLEVLTETEKEQILKIKEDLLIFSGSTDALRYSHFRESCVKGSLPESLSQDRAFEILSLIENIQNKLTTFVILNTFWQLEESGLSPDDLQEKLTGLSPQQNHDFFKKGLERLNAILSSNDAFQALTQTTYFKNLSNISKLGANWDKTPEAEVTLITSELLNLFDIDSEQFYTEIGIFSDLPPGSRRGAVTYFPNTRDFSEILASLSSKSGVFTNMEPYVPEGQKVNTLNAVRHIFEGKKAVYLTPPITNLDSIRLLFHELAHAVVFHKTNLTEQQFPACVSDVLPILFELYGMQALDDPQREWEGKPAGSAVEVWKQQNWLYLSRYLFLGQHNEKVITELKVFEKFQGNQARRLSKLSTRLSAEYKKAGKYLGQVPKGRWLDLFHPQELGVEAVRYSCAICTAGYLADKHERVAVLMQNIDKISTFSDMLEVLNVTQDELISQGIQFFAPTPSSSPTVHQT